MIAPLKSEDIRHVLNTSRTGLTFGFRTRMNFEECLGRTINWFSQRELDSDD